MENNQNSPEVFLHKGCNKDNNSLPQIQIIYNYLLENTATASMLSEATGIPQKNITRYKRKLEKAGKLWEVKKATCKKTGFKAFYLTTDPANAPKSNNNQLNLFDNGSK